MKLPQHPQPGDMIGTARVISTVTARLPACATERPADARKELGTGKAPRFQDRRQDDRYKSRAEREYAGKLDGMRRLGMIERWEYECMGFRIGDRCIFWPDFIVWTTAGIEIHEVKGRGKYALRPVARAKFLAAQTIYPGFVWRMFQREKDGWREILR